MTEIECPECGFDDMDKTEKAEPEDFFCYQCGELWKLVSV